VLAHLKQPFNLPYYTTRSNSHIIHMAIAIPYLSSFFLVLLLVMQDFHVKSGRDVPQSCGKSTKFPEQVSRHERVDFVIIAFKSSLDFPFCPASLGGAAGVPCADRFRTVHVSPFSHTPELGINICQANGSTLLAERTISMDLRQVIAQNGPPGRLFPLLQ
jgi:hypothetical protein